MNDLYKSPLRHVSFYPAAGNPSNWQLFSYYPAVLEKIVRADDPLIKQLNESHRVIGSGFDSIKSALRSLAHTVRAHAPETPATLAHRYQPLTTPPVPSSMGAQLTQLATKGLPHTIRRSALSTYIHIVDEMEILLSDVSRSAVRAKDVTSKLGLALMVLQASPVSPFRWS